MIRKIQTQEVLTRCIHNQRYLIIPFIAPPFWSYSRLHEPGLQRYLCHMIIWVFLHNIAKVNNKLQTYSFLVDIEGNFNCELSKTYSCAFLPTATVLGLGIRELVSCLVTSLISYVTLHKSLFLLRLRIPALIETRD